jgi:hypothetical protein
LRPLGERFLRSTFVASAIFLALTYGVAAGTYGWFPAAQFRSAFDGGIDLAGRLWIGDAGRRAHWFYRDVPVPAPPAIHDSGRSWRGVNLVTQVEDEGGLSIQVLAMDGACLHRWDVDWFELWPDASHVPGRFVPKARPGTHVHGAVLLEDGDVVFNFEHLGLVRLDCSGDVVWRLPYQTHHSVVREGADRLWVCGQKEHTAPSPAFPNMVAPFAEDTILLVTTDGRIECEWSVAELLRRSGYQGLLHLGSTDNFTTRIEGDVTHLNHVEPFPRDMQEGFFRHGDVLVSLRNVNTVFVFDRQQGDVRFVSTGQFVRQHDPHFVDGETISVFDNNNVGPEEFGPQSRIALLHARDRRVETVFAGSPDHPFFSPILGRHQWLPNGNLLITDACAGRAIELDRQGRSVWWYIHYLDEDTVGIVEQVLRLPAGAAQAFHRE